MSVVLQATGSHAWAVSGGWGAAAGSLGVLGTVVAPRARWGGPLDDDGGLAACLRRAGPGDVLLLAGFDWHSQVLHRTSRWRRRLAHTPARKILHVQESLHAGRRLMGSDEMEQAFRSAAELCDAVLYADPADRGLIEAAGRPALWQPFGVDPERFRPATPFAARQPRAFFRGKVDPLGNDEYSERRRILAHLRSCGLVEVVPYAPGEVGVASLVADFDRYQVALNLPSVFAGHPTRVLEGMACGCCVVTNRTGVAEVDALFEDGVELVYYSGEAEAEAALRRLRDDPPAAQVIAERGREAACQRYSLVRLLERALRWAQEQLPGALPRWRRSGPEGAAVPHRSGFEG